MLRTKGRKKRKFIDKNRYRLNHQIRIPEVMVIDNEGHQLGVMPTAKALALAEESGFDLVEVFPKSRPSVCRIMDYGQFQYQQSRKSQKTNVKKVETKGVRISFKIGQHDLEMRKNQAVKFLSKGDKVKVEMILRGREKKYHQDALQKVKEFIETIKTEQPINIEQEPKKQGGQISAIISASK
ncbi:MAG TPA: translation initiation factor IF-3 [Patescibacteria group bacterium]|nr:translation initiation factor IF-3 [Patescibacteria group bacterium]